MHLELSRLSVRYKDGPRPAVDEVSFGLAQGDIGVLIGPSGCGKTTLLRAIAGLEPVAGGEIRVSGQVVGSPTASVAPEARRIGKLRESFWHDLALTGTDTDLNKQLEQANRLCDYLELGELMARDSLMREESCGGHFRDEHQTPEGEARRDDANFAFVSAWEYTGPGKEPVMHKEPLVFENVELKTRSYK